MVNKPDTLKLRVIGKRKGFDTSPEAANEWLLTIKKLRGHDIVCPRGLYRFKTFEEADRWMRQALVESSLAGQRSTT